MKDVEELIWRFERVCPDSDNKIAPADTKRIVKANAALAQNAELISDLTTALADLLKAVEDDSRTKRGDYYHQRKNARAALKRATEPKS